MRKSFLLVSPAFLLSVGLLVLNDHLLKSSNPGWLTGKLSDFAGLFAFAVFWLVVFPQRPRFVLAAIAMIFSFWKSSLSQPLFDAWNGLGVFQIGRTVDYSDLIALAMLPLAKWFYDRATHVTASPRWVAVSAVAALFAFTATSPGPTPESQAEFARRYATFEFGSAGPTYVVSLRRDAIYAQWERASFHVSGSLAGDGHSANIIQFERIRAANEGKPRGQVLSILVKMDRAGEGSLIRLRTMILKRGPRTMSDAEAVRLFETLMIKPLGAAATPAPSRKFAEPP